MSVLDQGGFDGIEAVGDGREFCGGGIVGPDYQSSESR